MQSQSPVLRVTGLKKHFDVSRSFFGKPLETLRAVDGISLEVFPGETLGVVGESGCGKSTLGKLILRILRPSSGRIEFLSDGKYHDIGALSEPELRPLRAKMNMVFQDPFSSLNPRKPVRFIVGESLIVRDRLKGKALTDRVASLLEMVGLPANAMERFPHAFSGGQRQRIALARTLATNPTFLVLDEPVSALDLSVQSKIVNLFLDLQERLGLSSIFISHDIRVVRHVSDRVAVMYLGQVVEIAPPDEICLSPAHPYTEALISAVPLPQVSQQRQRIVLEGDLPNPLRPPSGCRFHTRCPYSTSLCKEVAPSLEAVGGSVTHLSACHYRDGLTLQPMKSPVQPA